MTGDATFLQLLDAFVGGDGEAGAVLLDHVEARGMDASTVLFVAEVSGFDTAGALLELAGARGWPVEEARAALSAAAARRAAAAAAELAAELEAELEAEAAARRVERRLDGAIVLGRALGSEQLGMLVSTMLKRELGWVKFRCELDPVTRDLYIEGLAACRQHYEGMGVSMSALEDGRCTAGQAVQFVLDLIVHQVLSHRRRRWPCCTSQLGPDTGKVHCTRHDETFDRRGTCTGCRIDARDRQIDDWRFMEEFAARREIVRQAAELQGLGLPGPAQEQEHALEYVGWLEAERPKS